MKLRYFRPMPRFVLLLYLDKQKCPFLHNLVLINIIKFEYSMKKSNISNARPETICTIAEKLKYLPTV